MNPTKCVGEAARARVLIDNFMYRHTLYKYEILNFFHDDLIILHDVQ